MAISRYYGLFFAAILLFSACKKPTLQDSSLIPSENLSLLFTDTLSVRTYTVKEDSIAMNSVTLCALGHMDDAAFGQTRASFYLPFRLQSDNPVFDDTTITLDSIVLYLRYFSTYGDWRHPQTINVFEMSEGIDDSTDYYSNKTFEVNPAIVGSISGFIPNTRDSVQINGASHPPLMRIKLNNSFGQKFIDSSGTASYANNSNFRKFFKGLYISASKQSGGKGLVFFDPYPYQLRSVSRLVVYYHDVQDSAKSLGFPAAQFSFVNHYEHNYSSSIAEPFLTRPNTATGDSLIFIQGLAGVNTIFVVPYISNLGNIIINRAELVLTQAQDASFENSLFPPPGKMVLSEVNNDRTIGSAVPDQNFPSSIFGGEMKTETDSTGTFTRYRFSLSRYYQQMLQAGSDNGIFILPDKRFHSASRLIAGGGSHSKYALKLNLTYSKTE